MKSKIAFCLLGFLSLLNCSTPESPTDEVPDNSVLIDVNSIESDPWWDDAVFYEIFVRSFYDSNGDGIGDLRGLIEKLDYLNDGNPSTTNDLGVTALWLMPIFPSPSYHGYDVIDYRSIHPDYGTMDDFKALITAAHARGIKVIIDFVGNHTSDQHPWFQDALENGSKRNWYRWTDAAPNYQGPWGQNVWHERNNNYYYGIFWGGMPDLNYTNPEVTNEIKNIVRYWYEDIGVDGFRIDAVKHWIENGSQQENTSATLQWWREFYAYQKNIDPALMTVGEAWTSTQNIAPYSDSRLDYCFEFDLANSIIDAVINQNATQLKIKLNEIMNTYAHGQYGTFLTNHDQDRSFNRFGQDLNKAKLGASLLLSLPGVPYLYYGEEIGMTGQKPDELIRTPMQWSGEAQAGFTSSTPWQSVNNNYTDFNLANQQSDPQSLWHHYQKWIRFRTQNPALRSGDLQWLNSDTSGILPFARHLQGEESTLLVIHNLSSQSQESTSISGQIKNLTAGTFTLTDLETQTEITTLEIDGSGAFVMQLDRLLEGRESKIFRLTPQS